MTSSTCARFEDGTGCVSVRTNFNVRILNQAYCITQLIFLHGNTDMMEDTRSKMAFRVAKPTRTVYGQALESVHVDNLSKNEHSHIPRYYGRSETSKSESEGINLEIHQL